MEACISIGIGGTIYKVGVQEPRIAGTAAGGPTSMPFAHFMVGAQIKRRDLRWHQWLLNPPPTQVEVQQLEGWEAMGPDGPHRQGRAVVLYGGIQSIIGVPASAMGAWLVRGPGSVVGVMDLLPPSVDVFMAQEGGQLLDACRQALWKPVIALVTDISMEDKALYVTPNMPIGQMAEVIADLLAHGKVVGVSRRERERIKQGACAGAIPEDTTVGPVGFPVDLSDFMVEDADHHGEAVPSEEH